jgi:hypothetical protein
VIEVTGTRAGQNYTDSVTFNNTPPLPQIPALTGTPYARINFQPAASSAIAGYSADNGLVYGLRSDGKSYGWNADNSANTRERTSGFLATPPDSRYTRLAHMQRNGVFTWELAVPNGMYDVHLVAGDASFIDSTHVIDLEGRIALQGTPTAAAPWIESIVRVTVSDGRLTVSSDISGKNDKIAYIDINSTPFATLDGSTLNLNFDGSANPITLGTSGTDITATRSGTTYSFPSASVAGITGNGTASADYLVVNSIISQPMNFIGGLGNDLIDVSAGASLRFEQSQQVHALNIAGGSVILGPAGNRVLSLDTLAIDANGKLDLADNAMIVTSGEPGSWNGSSYTGVMGLVAAGHGDGSWNGNGIVTSSPNPANSNYKLLGLARASDVLGIGPADAGVWRGRAVTGSDVLMMYTYGGDANLDGKLNILDYVRIDQGLAGGLAGWSNGDFNYDGVINILDYAIIDTNLPVQGPPV